MSDIKKEVKISVRNLVEFILVEGDIDNRKARTNSVTAMQEGTRIHKKIQKSMGSNYRAEESLSLTVEIKGEDYDFDLTIEGRADGIYTTEDELADTFIDEIKGMYMDISTLEEPFGVHLAQAKCYAYIYGLQEQKKNIGVQITYCNIESEVKKYFKFIYTIEALEEWFYSLIKEYSKWAVQEYKWQLLRDVSIKEADFPFEYREGQRKLVGDVYRTIIRDKRLFIQAPTGVGKTISTVYPAIKAMGEGQVDKIFYLTAKTITRTVAQETAQILQRRGLKLRAATITAKEKICVLDKPDCNPVSCERAKGHYDRVNDAVFDLISNEDEITREIMEEYATKHMVCPFEMSLDVTNWSDFIVCDYNYVFDPNVYLKRFFSGDKKKNYVYLIDEAHNLVDRARQMYSAVLYKRDFLLVEKLVKKRSKKFAAALSICNKDMIEMKRECEEVRELTNITDFVFHLLRLITLYDEYMKENPVSKDEEEILTLYLDVLQFLKIFELYDEKYITYIDYDENNNFRIKLLCMDPSTNINHCLNKGKSAIFFSATLLPIQYYKEQLAGREEDYAVYAETPFQSDMRRILLGYDVSTKYSRRNEREYRKIANYIHRFVNRKVGNYIVFLPSYQMMNQIADICKETMDNLVLQKQTMTEAEREEFLQGFLQNPKESRIGFCVMGGIFSEGIDLKKDRLIGTVIVGTGLPMVSNENELFKNYYDNRNGKGFDYAYLYPGMNKVLQSAGRVIRTTEDMGCILLLDDRFHSDQYVNLFPKEWFPYDVVNVESMEHIIDGFWNQKKE